MWRCLPVIICGDRISDPGRIDVGIDDADGRDVVQPAFMKQVVILQRVQADDQIRLQGGLADDMVFLSGQLAVEFIHEFQRALAEYQLCIRDATGDPALEEMTGARHLRRFDDKSPLSATVANKQDQSSSFAHLGHDLCRAS